MTANPHHPFSPEAIQESGAARVIDGAIELTAGPVSDLFFEPGTGRMETSAAIVGTVVDDLQFQFSARVSADLRATFDGGVLLVRPDSSHWGKICLEQDPKGVPTAVSVVTREVSDDANGWPLGGTEAWLRISRDYETFAFHVSANGVTWDLLRLFSLPASGPVEVGLLSQSPTGQGCVSRFSDIAYTPTALADNRDGS